VSEPKIDYQCYICPWCYNDHNNDKCKTKDVKERVEKLEAKLSFAVDLLKAIRRGRFSDRNRYDLIDRALAHLKGSAK